MQRSPIALRVSCVALPTCGSSTTLSIASSAARNVGLVGEHVEARRLDRAVLQRRHERRLVDDRAARDVDERALLAERREHFGVDDVASSRRRRDTRRSGNPTPRRAPSGRRRSGTARPAACARCRRSACPSPSAAARSPCRCGRGPGCRRVLPASLVVSSGPRFFAIRRRARSDWRARSRGRSSAPAPPRRRRRRRSARRACW